MGFKKGQTPAGAKPFVKGQSGNPAGRPPKDQVLQDALDQVLAEEENGAPLVLRIVKKLGHMAVKGDVKAATLLLAHAYGQPRQRVEHSTDKDAPSAGVQWVIQVPAVNPDQQPDGKKKK